jgi:hypothetical protein
MKMLNSLAGVLLARIYAALIYLSSMLLMFGAAALTSTHARVAFIFVFIPGVLLAVLAVFVWLGKRAAMILAFAVSLVVELMLVGNDPANWWQLLAMPALFAAFTAGGVILVPKGEDPPARVADEVYAAMAYFAGLLAVFMAPFNFFRQFGAPGAALYALVVGLTLGGLSVLIWRGRLPAMIAAFVLSLAHWLVLAGLVDPSFWSNIAFIAAPVASGILTVVCFALTSRSSRRSAPAANSPDKS